MKFHHALKQTWHHALVLLGAFVALFLAADAFYQHPTDAVQIAFASAGFYVVVWALLAHRLRGGKR